MEALEKALENSKYDKKAKQGFVEEDEEDISNMFRIDMQRDGKKPQHTKTEQQNSKQDPSRHQSLTAMKEGIAKYEAKAEQ